LHVEAVIGYVTRDMAIDGCCPEREGEPIKGIEVVTCEICNGYGKIGITEDEYEAEDD
jgi:hypothetical protein